MTGAGPGRPMLSVGIAGGSAAGKSTVVSELVGLLGEERTAVLRHDAYYHDLSHLPLAQRVEVNVDHPDSLETALLVEHVRVLGSGRPVEMPDYDYVSQTRAPRGVMVDPSPVLIVEGLFTLFDERLRALWDLAVFVETPESERLDRRIARDGTERGRERSAVVAQHERVVQPMHERFIEPSRAHADVLIRGGGHNREAVAELAQRVLGLVGGGA